MFINPQHAIDFYKADHRRQYPEGTELVVSNFTARSDRLKNVEGNGSIRVFGISYLAQWLQHYWYENFFSRPLGGVLRKYKRVMDNALGKDAFPLDHIEALWHSGVLPIEIKALPEGSSCPIGVPFMTIHNTKPEFFWLTNYLETIISCLLWLPCTSATTAWNYRQLCDKYATLTGSPEWFTDFQCHDFSFRGMGSFESAVVSAAGHSLSFKGSDTVPVIDFMEEYYHANHGVNPVAMSVPATEHSVMCMGGEQDELETFRRLIISLYPKGIVSIVSDTWDFWQVITEYALTLHQEIMSRDGKVVFRPDSGDPVDIIAGDPNAKDGSPEQKGAVECLWDIFGGTVTETGHKLLDSHVGLIYGDSITYARARGIFERLAAKGFASANVVLGIGSYTYQYVTRDTWGFAIKATYGVVNGEARNLYKSPKTDSGSKKSAKGLLVVNPDMTLSQEATWEDFASDKNMLKTVYKDGVHIVQPTFDEIRERMKS